MPHLKRRVRHESRPSSVEFTLAEDDPTTMSTISTAIFSEISESESHTTANTAVSFYSSDEYDSDDGDDEYDEYDSNDRDDEYDENDSVPDDTSDYSEGSHDDNENVNSTDSQNVTGYDTFDISTREPGSEQSSTIVEANASAEKTEPTSHRHTFTQTASGDFSTKDEVAHFPKNHSSDSCVHGGSTLPELDMSSGHVTGVTAEVTVLIRDKKSYYNIKLRKEDYPELDIQQRTYIKRFYLTMLLQTLLSMLPQTTVIDKFPGANSFKKSSPRRAQGQGSSADSSANRISTRLASKLRRGLGHQAEAEAWTMIPVALHASLSTNQMNQRTSKKLNKTLIGKYEKQALAQNTNGEIVCYKLRWMVRGFEQIEGLDCSKTFASVVEPMSYKARFAITTAKGLEIE
ncbi:hypothetical protein TSTA_008480 [Talaromyces stipitatus ATCC 10500]|uniref:Reverse transcriptase Ty1/copia-type domain-containing protein n=1 Tax=Talaromyces stipitatus (strain ATCC 10500 / CBS 375.48 / QM 6759 / NRRL 1006) TaxID=441959 RepID=B8MV96_TALSN|nr:uncharacterized protein TSTA_008480 [Talaromyces stipitatus ATCC 10500]EED11552.1 hypothetical protein TSTA_008480 [Talaromyces stipitatus ATCC 10500]